MGSPVFKFPEITKNLYNGKDGIVNLEEITKEIKITTGFYKQGTVTEIIKVMVELGFIKEHPDGFRIVSFDGKKMIPEIEKRIEKEIEQELKEFNIESGDKDAS